MLGSFTQEALDHYEELVRFHEKRAKRAPAQGEEWIDNAGIGPNDQSFHDSDESQTAADYSEVYDFTRCIRSDGTLYGIADGKKCRKGTETKVEPKATKEKEQRRKTITRQGVGTLRQRRTAEKETKAKAEERRRSKDPYTNHNRVGQIQALVGKATRALDRLQGRRKAVKKETPYSQRLDARIKRLQGAISKLQNEKYRLQKQNPPKGEGFGSIPEAYERGRGLA